MLRGIVCLLLLTFACSPKYSNLRYAEIATKKARSQYESFGKKYMVSTQGEATTKAAKFVLDRGGNIFDAAVAASFAISVERPHSTGIGGGGFMLLYHAKTKKTVAFDFREMAPRLSNSKMFLDKKGKQVTDRSLTGALAVGTPGLVAGVLEIHKEYGSLPLSVVMEPAIQLAEKGFPIYPALNEAITEEAPRLCKFNASKQIFLHEDCSARSTGERLVQSDLAKTLKTIARDGKSGFYAGYVANQIVKYQKQYGGLIRHTDLKGYQVKKREPVEGQFRGFKIASMPTPSSGGVHVIQILNILENFDLAKWGPQDYRSIHITSSAMQMAFADRAKYLGDSDFKPVPTKDLISKQYARKLSTKINLERPLKSEDFPIGIEKIMQEPDHTTHFTIMDGEGNVATSTQTINGWFGSAMVTPGTGIVMNNEMDDFASHVGGVNLFGAIGGANNLVEPRKRPLSSMSPTIVFDKAGRPVLALGTPSGTRILTCVMQTILNYVEHRLPLWEAVSATRYHHQWYPEEIRIGPPYFTERVEAKLKEMGHKVNHKSLGCKVQAIAFDGVKLHGVSDPREEGMSFGM